MFMDGRPHPPAYAPHSWTGFSTGEWIGNTLKVTTTHLKDGYLRRGGPQTSDMYTMTEFITRHDDILTIVTVIDDPIYQDQPYIHSTTYTFDPTFRLNTETCNGPAVAENGGTDRHFVPHFLPGTNKEALDEWITNGGLIAGAARANVDAQDWVHLVAARGGVKTLYPEYRSTLNGAVKAESLHGADVALVDFGGQDDCGPESQRRRGPRAAGARQRLHAGGGRHQHHRVSGPGRRGARECRVVADVRQAAGGRQPDSSRRP